MSKSCTKRSVSKNGTSNGQLGVGRPQALADAVPARGSQPGVGASCLNSSARPYLQLYRRLRLRKHVLGLYRGRQPDRAPRFSPLFDNSRRPRLCQNYNHPIAPRAEVTAIDADVRRTWILLGDPTVRLNVTRQ